MTEPSQPTVRALPLTIPSSMTSWSPKRHRPPPNQRALGMMMCSLNQSKPYLSANIVYSHLNRRSAESAHDGFLRKNSHAVNTPAAANHKVGEAGAVSRKSRDE